MLLFIIRKGVDDWLIVGIEYLFIKRQNRFRRKWPVEFNAGSLLKFKLNLVAEKVETHNGNITLPKRCNGVDAPNKQKG